MRTAPPEFAASQLVRLAESLVKNDKEWQRELFEEAFALARQAKQPFKRPVLNVDTFIGRNYSRTVAELGMDRLSLQCGALRGLLEIDRKRALELMAELEAPRLPITACEEPFAPEVDGFYQLLIVMAQRGFTREQQERGEDLDFLEPYLRQVDHPAQVAPAARVVRFVGTTPERLERLLTIFLAALDKVRNDDRAFTQGNNLPSAAELMTLAVFSSQHGQRSDEILAQLRTYLIEHLNGRRCSDNVLSASGKPVAAPQVVRDFNQFIELNQRKLEPIDEDELKPQVQGSAARDFRYWRTPTAAKLQQRFYALQHGVERNMPEPNPSVWLPQVNEFFQAVEAWEIEPETQRADFYHQKCLLYSAAFEWIQLGAQREQLLRDYLALLSKSREHIPSFGEWYAHLREFMRRYEGPDRQAQREQVLEALRNSSDPFYQLLAKLDKSLASK